ncbi:unnamed protein product [[Candida] boidinii]|uniref:Unnamed protein product n=1 Tax=Candida boidinii TaxID=5477 RepID=A0A9W6SYM0_CANBO|nr:unnamed protein product [[Candida] boidinii]
MTSVLKMTSSVLSKNLKVALIQFHSGGDKSLNLQKCKEFIHIALTKDPKLDMIVLPECWNSPYSVNEFKNYSENIPNGETTKFLSDLAKENKNIIIGGSYPELTSDDEVYNTSVSFDRNGEIIAKHRKTHLFDIDIPNKITFKESISLKAGNKATVFELPEYGNVGLGICYDIRFQELAMIAARPPNNVFAMIYPGAFNTATGPLHWHLLARTRAVDNQRKTYPPRRHFVRNQGMFHRNGGLSLKQFLNTDQKWRRVLTIRGRFTHNNVRGTNISKVWISG